MYPRPQVICVAAFVRQSAPADAIFEPGSDCGMPYAPEDAFWALTRQPDSLVQSLSRHANWSAPQPRSAISACAVAFAVPGVTTTVEGSIVPTTMTSVRGSRVTSRETTVRSTSAPPSERVAYVVTASPGRPVVRTCR